MYLKIALVAFLFIRFNESKAVSKLVRFDNGVVVLSWTVDREFGYIMFDLKVETTGYVGLGISPITGGMLNADIVIGGVKDGQTYFNDYHTGPTVRSPIVDNKQNWFLLEGRETDTHTYLKFWRLFNTFDAEEDAIIDVESGEATIIWSYGTTDDIGYHTAKGSAKITF